jgi:head-tail adaptor
MPLREGQLARQRALALRDLTDRCTIERYTQAQDDTGEVVSTFAALATDVPCRVVAVGSVTGAERLRLDAMAQVTDWIVVVPAEQDVTSKDQVRITQGSSAGRLFEVSQVLGPHTDEVRRRLMVDEVT